ncbi:MAG: 3-hydroxyacyl-CoA dehydrogenase NAD-binding domain-containing protein [Chloroflexota bacterium]
MTAESAAIVGVIGVGTMGAGIAQVALEAGHEVVIHDIDEVAIARGRERIRDGLARRATKLDLDADSIEEWIEGRLSRLRESETIAGLATEVDVAIEAALEDLELKRDIFRALDAASAPDAILATNTSALSVAAIAEAATRPERIVGLHFFNPAPVMKLVEVVSGPRTDPSVADRAAALVASWGKTAVRSADSPGFIVNRVNRPFTIQALRIVEVGEASVEEIDAAIRADGFPMGPFELIDLAGVDVNLAAARGVWDGLGRPDRLRPSPIQERLVDAGRLGRKTGSGFYRYEGGRRASVDPEFAAEAPAILAEVEIRDRILAAVANEAREAAREGVATESDIDLALRLGAAHPMGPFERLRSPAGSTTRRHTIPS